MSTLVEIQDAVTQLSPDEQKALRIWLESHACPDVTPADEAQLLHSLDEAVSELNAGKGVSIIEARRRIGSWAAR
jgi:hypothetical protein